jgi:hypothetical protein
VWVPKITKIKGSKFKLPCEGPYKMQEMCNNNTVELNNLSNNDVERVNINKLKKYRFSETLTMVMTIVVNIERNVKSI